MTRQPKSPLTPLSGVALWRRIADTLRLDIIGGKLSAGDRLGTEAELAQRFDANRHTVRRALAVLQEEGVVRTEQGRGSFVENARRLTYRIGRRTRFSEGLAGQAGNLSSRLLSTSRETASASVARTLGTAPGARLVRLESLSLGDNRPLSRATTWLEDARFPDFAAVFAETASITAALRHFGIDDYARAETRISARHADVEETASLRLAPGAIVLVSEAVDADPAGRPLLYALSRFPAERLELVI